MLITAMFNYDSVIGPYTDDANHKGNPKLGTLCTPRLVSRELLYETQN